MKNQKGVTLSSLVVYIIAMILVIGIMTSVTLNFNKNLSNLESSTLEVSKIGEFNVYFIKEIKLPNNGVDRIDDNGKYIIFKSGNSFSFRNDNVYYNDIKITDNIKNLSFSFSNQDIKDVVKVKFEFDRFSKEINYKIEEIY